LLRDVVPKADVIAFLVNPNYPEGRAQIEDVLSSARAVGQDLIVLTAGSESEIEAAFASILSRKPGGLVVASDPFFSADRARIIALAAKHALPAIYYERIWVALGGLMSYTTDAVEMYRQLGIYAARILKGEKPANLPIMKPTKFELVINLTAAKALGLTISPALLCCCTKCGSLHVRCSARFSRMNRLFVEHAIARFGGLPTPAVTWGNRPFESQTAST
jgi:putative ABC transport system substrate-binding protein